MLSGRSLGPSQVHSPTRARGACWGGLTSPGGLSSSGQWKTVRPLSVLQVTRSAVAPYTPYTPLHPLTLCVLQVLHVFLVGVAFIGLPVSAAAGYGPEVAAYARPLTSPHTPALHPLAFIGSPVSAAAGYGPEVAAYARPLTSPYIPLHPLTRPHYICTWSARWCHAP